VKRNLIRHARVVGVALFFTCAALVCVSVWRTRTAQTVDDSQQQFHARVRDGVGNSVRFPAQGDSAATIRASVDSLASFVDFRAGVSLDETNRTRLTNMEAAALAGTTQRLTIEELGSALAEVAMERIDGLTDAQIASAAETFRGFNAPDLPQSFQRGREVVKLRADKVDNLTPAQFTDQVKAIRDASPAQEAIYRGAAQALAEQEVKERVELLKAAIPDKFLATNETLTPFQAVLVAYSAASDDLLGDSATNLQQRMTNMQARVSSITGAAYPSPSGHHAYGPNGYIFSTPTDLMFEQQVLSRLLDEIAERSVN
jgi:hypothetical protein